MHAIAHITPAPIHTDNYHNSIGILNVLTPNLFNSIKWCSMVFIFKFSYLENHLRSGNWKLCKWFCSPSQNLHLVHNFIMCETRHNLPNYSIMCAHTMCFKLLNIHKRTSVVSKCKFPFNKYGNVRLEISSTDCIQSVQFVQQCSKKMYVWVEQYRFAYTYNEIRLDNPNHIAIIKIIIHKVNAINMEFEQR